MRMGGVQLRVMKRVGVVLESVEVKGCREWSRVGKRGRCRNRWVWRRGEGGVERVGVRRVGEKRVVTDCLIHVFVRELV